VRTQAAGVSLAACLAAGCPTPPRAHEQPREGAPAESAPRVNASASARSEAAPSEPLPPEAAAPAPPAEAGEDAMALHRATSEELLALLVLPERDSGADPASRLLPYLVAPVPGRFNDGNPATAHHSIGRQACLEGLRGAVTQTEEQKRVCRGKPNMVPIFKGGLAAGAKTCIDVFEFPNVACELPWVWGTPSEAEKLCELEGKRLCTQAEWNLACEGDPEGKPDSTYAYGDALDLTICNTNKPHAMGPDGQWLCNPRSAQLAWATCNTETEPAGAFPRCKSRFGVYDQHGNVAEMMTRKDGDTVYTQLKGSAFFYVDVSRNPGEAQKPGSRETYPDHCGYDPRWHVEVLGESVHSNYHLGFRCCLGI